MATVAASPHHTPEKLGPGTLKIGATGSEIDVSCLINGAVISAKPDRDDPVYKLCGTSTEGKVTYNRTLKGNVDIDSATSTGLFALSQEHAGEEEDFEFVPNTAIGTKAVGKLVIDPLDFGGDEYGKVMTSDFEWSVLEVKYTYGTGAPAVVNGAGT